MSSMHLCYHSDVIHVFYVTYVLARYLVKAKAGRFAQFVNCVNNSVIVWQGH